MHHPELDKALKAPQTHGKLVAWLQKRYPQLPGPEDCVQDALLMAWEQRETYDPKRASPSTWLHTLTRLLARRKVKHHIDMAQPLTRVSGGKRVFVKSEGRWKEAIGETSPPPDSKQLDAKMALEAVERANPRAAYILQEHYLRDRSYEDLGVELGISKQAVEQSLSALDTVRWLPYKGAHRTQGRERGTAPQRSG